MEDFRSPTEYDMDEWVRIEEDLFTFVDIKRMCFFWPNDMNEFGF
ncbi:MAG TPA: hypothetical protein VIY47_08210 [Ignavibacteriaceae bacterium]